VPAPGRGCGAKRVDPGRAVPAKPKKDSCQANYRRGGKRSRGVAGDAITGRRNGDIIKEGKDKGGREIILTGYASMDLAVEWTNPRAFGYLEKP